MTLTVGSTFTGVGGADLGFEWAGYKIGWQCELDAWKRSVLAAHWPDIPIYDDIIKLHDPEPVDVMIGGFPCQDLSVAGKRKGFDGDRSVLAFEFLRVAESLKPRWLVLENVPGLLSSNKGLDFQRLLSEVVACGYGVGWRCLDARYFGVPQRRRRIFVVARRTEAGVGSRDASGLALRALCEGGVGDSTPCVPSWQEVAADVGVGSGEGRIVGALSARGYTQYTDQEFVRAGQLVTDADVVSFYPTGGSQAFTRTDGVSPALKRGSGVGAESGTAIAFSHTQGLHEQASEEAWPTLRVGGGGQAVAEGPMVRRLTPVECERLMAWPDGHTAPEGIKAPDSRRYAACGDGIVANVAYWIAQRIKMIEGEA